MTERELEIFESGNRSMRQQQKELERSNNITLILVAFNIFTSVWCIVAGNMFCYFAAALNAYSAAASVSAWRIGKQFCRARLVFCDAMEGMFKAYKERNRTALEHYDDQSNAALEQMSKLHSTIEPWLPRLK